MLTSRNRIIAAAAAAVALLTTALALAVTGPASAAASKPAAGPAAVTWFQLKSADLANTCVAVKGTTDVVYGTACSSNHAEFWERTSTGELLNEHSHMCLSVTGSQPGVYMNNCVDNHAQWWTVKRVPVIAGGKTYTFTEYVNVHAHLSLALVPSAKGIGLDQESSGDTLWAS